MKRFLILILLLAGCAEVEPGNYYLVPAGTITPDYQYCEGGDCWAVQKVTAGVPVTPVDTVTPTPEPTFPPINTFEPTQETTPLPTIPATSIPVDTNCYAGVVSAGLNVRTDHAISSARIGILSQAFRIPVLSIHVVYAEGSPRREEWGSVLLDGRVGWIALWYDGDELAVLDDSEFCWELPKEYEEHPLPVVYDGFHTLAGEGAGILLAPQFYKKYKTIKCLDGGWQLCLDAKSRDPEMIIIARSFLHDRVDPKYYNDPEGWWNQIRNSLPYGFDYYEIMNEVDWPVEYSNQWAQWNIQMAGIIERERGAALLAFSSGPGNPDLPWWKGLWTYVDWSKTRLAPNGLQHGIATHSSAFAPPSVPLPAGSWVNNPYISDRIGIVCQLALDNHYGNGTGCKGVVWFLTELGVTDGYQGSQGVFSCSQKALMYKETIRKLQESAQEMGLSVIGFNWWNIGKIGQWSSDHDCVGEMLWQS